MFTVAGKKKKYLYCVCTVTTQFEKLRTLKKCSKCVKLGQCQRTLKKKFQSARISAIEHGSLKFSFFKFQKLL